MRAPEARASRLALLAAAVGLILGGTALWLGLSDGSVVLGGFAGACLLQLPPALSLRNRIRDGLGNSGLERERLTLKTVSLLLRLLALAMAMAAVSALLGDRSPQASPTLLGLAALATGIQAGLWLAKRGLAGLHPALDLDAARARTLLELAALLLVGMLLGFWFPLADAVAGLLVALRLFLAGRTLAKGTTLQAAPCGGCGGGCG
jgi:hypothetical protein